MKLTAGKITILALAVLVPAGFTLKVVAQSFGQNIYTTQAQASTTEETEAIRKQKLQDRLDARKQKQALNLSAADSARIASRCVNAQGKIRSLEGRVQGIETSRLQSYANIKSRLDKLVDKLKANNVDTTNLVANIAQYGVKTDTFFNLLTEYKQATADMGAMDCTTDAEGFQASLMSARDALATLRTSAEDIRSYLKNDVQQTLKTIRQQLVKTEE